MEEKKNPILAEIADNPGVIETLGPEAVPRLRAELVRIDSLLLARLMSASGRVLPR